MSQTKQGHPIRLALCGLPQLVACVVAELLKDHDEIEVIGSVRATGDLRADFERSGADVLVCALEEADMDRQWRLALLSRPALTVLNLVDDSRHGRLYALWPHEQDEEHLDGSALLEALHRHARALRRSAPLSTPPRRPATDPSSGA